MDIDDMDMTNEPQIDSVDQIPLGLSDDEIDEVIAHGAARRWAAEMRAALGIDDE